MKKILLSLASISIISSVSSTVVACNLPNSSSNNLNRLGQNGDLREFVKEEVIKNLSNSSALKAEEITSFTVGDPNIDSYFSDAIEKYIASESEVDEWIKEGTVEIVDFWWSFDDENENSNNSSTYKIEKGQTLDFKNNNFAIKIDYIEVESELFEPDEEEWETDYIGFIGENKKIDISDFTIPSTRNSYIEYDKNDTIYELYEEIVEQFSEQNFNEFRNKKSDQNGMPTNFIMSEVDGNGDIIVEVEGITTMNDVSNNKKSNVIIKPNNITTIGNEKTFEVTFRYDD